jgi:hypothetical protein
VTVEGENGSLMPRWRRDNRITMGRAIHLVCLSGLSVRRVLVEDLLSLIQSAIGLI